LGRSFKIKKPYLLNQTQIHLSFMRFITLFFVILLLGACSNKKDPKKNEETAVKYTPRLKNPEQPIIPKADSAYLGQIQFLKDDAISITLPDSTIIVAQQVNATTRKYHLAKDTFLIFSTRNYKKGFKIYSNDNRALWSIQLKDQSIEIMQENFEKNLFEVLVNKDNLMVRHKTTELGKVLLESNKAIFSKNSRKLFEISADTLLLAYGILLIEEIGIEERYALFAEVLARGY